MRIFNNIDSYQRSQQPLWVSIGTFDGMHLGHQYLINQLKEYSHKVHEDARTMIITFDVHPQLLFIGESPRPITTNRHKIQLLEHTGIDDTLVMTFTPELAEVSAEDFIVDYLVEKLKISGIVLGYNNTFGHKGLGNINLLRRYAQKYDFTALTAKPYFIDDAPVSSTRIREKLQAGDLNGAKEMLGRYFSVLGIVIKGVQRGRELGVPTANIKMGIGFLPPLGVYGVRVRGIDEKAHFGVANIGYNPSFHMKNPESLKPQLEVHLFDYSGNLYGKELTVDFITRIRDETRFNKIEDLIAEIHNDISKFKSFISENEPNL